jgi:hypothetical protein
MKSWPGGFLFLAEARGKQKQEAAWKFGVR